MSPNMSLWRTPTVLATALFILAGTAPTAFAAPPPKPSMDGETFSGVPTVTFTCDPMTSSTINFTVTGTATGPYPGTFTETGTATLGPQGIWKDPNNPNAPGDVTGFTATFTIQAANGFRVNGFKHLAPPGTLAGNLGFCDPFGIQSFGAQSTYTAAISSKGPACVDTGDAGTAVNAGITYPVAQFNESFSTNHPLC